MRNRQIDPFKCLQRIKEFVQRIRDDKIDRYVLGMFLNGFIGTSKDQKNL
jgi:hypothetical protein